MILTSFAALLPVVARRPGESLFLRLPVLGWVGVARVLPLSEAAIKAAQDEVDAKVTSLVERINTMTATLEARTPAEDLPLSEAERQVDCPKCQRKAGSPCVNRDGNRARRSHNERNDALRAMQASTAEPPRCGAPEQVPCPPTREPDPLSMDGEEMMPVEVEPVEARA